jgi:hypothetical protein
MCVAIPVALALAGTAVTAGSAVMGGYQQAAQAKFAAAQATQNSQLATSQAQQVQAQGAQDALNKQRQIHAMMGEQTVGFASQGLDTTYGTASDVVSGTAQLGSEDVARMRQATQDRVNSLLIQSSNYSDTASAEKQAAGNAVTSGWLKAGGTVLSGASQAFGAKNPALSGYSGSTAINPGGPKQYGYTGGGAPF